MILKIKRNTQAGLSFFAAITCFAVVSFYYGAGAFIDKTMYDNFLVKATDLQCDYELSLYNSNLKNRYGLLALSDKDVRQLVSDICRQMQDPLFFDRPPVYVDKQMIYPWSENKENLEEQIKQLSLLRLGPAFMIQIKNNFQNIIMPAKKALQESISFLQDARDSVDKIKEVLNFEIEEDQAGGFKDESWASWKKKHSWLKDNLGNYLRDIEKNLAADIPEEFAVQTADTNEKFSALLQLCDNLDTQIRKVSSFIPDMVPINTFLINSFSYHTAAFGSKKANSSNTEESRTADKVGTDIFNREYVLSGLARAGLEPAKYKHQVEMMITGLDDAAAFKRIKVVVASLRFVSNYYGFHHSDQFKEYLHIAQTISTLMAIISLGHIQVPAEAIMEIYALIKAFLMTKNDMTDILNGAYLDLIPYVNDYQVDYTQYLFVLSFFSEKSALIDRIIGTIEEEYGEKFFDGIRISSSYNLNGRSHSVVQEKYFAQALQYAK